MKNNYLGGRQNFMCVRKSHCGGLFDCWVPTCIKAAYMVHTGTHLVLVHIFVAMYSQGDSCV